MNNCGTNCKSSAQKHSKKAKRFDYLFWITLIIIILSYFTYYFFMEKVAGLEFLDSFTSSVFSLINRMAWGLILAIVFVGLINKIPRELMTGLLGRGGTITGIFRATLAGVLLDLCSHGILLVGMKLYERGASLGQTMAFLIASPWNSISLTFILWALIGFKWMISFLLLSMLIAIISGMIFELLVKKKVLPRNPNTVDLPENYIFFYEAGKFFKKTKFHPKSILTVLKDGVTGSRMILRWIFLGVIIASFLRSFLTVTDFQTLFGPTIAGLGLTLLTATIIEVCSEGSTPIAADILSRAGAPGNAFAFLMTGVSTDYTEILALKETTKSWKIAFFLPLITLPQVILIALIMNGTIF